MLSRTEKTTGGFGPATESCENYGPCLDFVYADSMSFQAGLMDQMEATQREFLDA